MNAQIVNDLRLIDRRYTLFFPLGRIAAPSNHGVQHVHYLLPLVGPQTPLAGHIDIVDVSRVSRSHQPKFRLKKGLSIPHSKVREIGARGGSLNQFTASSAQLRQALCDCHWIVEYVLEDVCYTTR
jgi:hypothetical protein